MEVADKAMDAMSLLWPVLSPQKQPLGHEFFPETSLFLGEECLAEGAALEGTAGSPALGWRVGGLKRLQPPHKSLPFCGDGGGAPRRPIIHWGRSPLWGSVYRVHLMVGVTWGGVHEPTSQSVELTSVAPFPWRGQGGTGCSQVIRCLEHLNGREAALMVLHRPLPNVHGLTARCPVPRSGGAGSQL